MEVAVAPIPFPSPAGPPSRATRRYKNEPVPQPQAHSTQFILVAALRVYTMYSGAVISAPRPEETQRSSGSNEREG